MLERRMASKGGIKVTNIDISRMFVYYLPSQGFPYIKLDAEAGKKIHNS